MILEHDQVNAVGEVALGRLGKLHVENLLVDRRPSLHDDGLARWRRRLAALRMGRRCGEREHEPDRCEVLRARRHQLPPRPAAALGVVTITERFSATRYFFATRCTSAGVTAANRETRVLMRPGSL